MRIRELMSQPAVTCRIDESLNTAARLMWEHDCGSVVVIDGDGALVGILTDRDVCMAAYTQGIALTAIPCATAMSARIFSCQPEDSVACAERLMRDRRIRRVPIVDSQNRPVGMLSLNDVARYAESVRAAHGMDREVTETLAAVCQPRWRGVQTLTLAHQAGPGI
jgi:CBS domain-containing protein